MPKLVNRTQSAISFTADNCSPEQGNIAPGESIDLNTNPDVREIPRIVFGNPIAEGENGETYEIVKALNVRPDATVTVSVSIE